MGLISGLASNIILLLFLWIIYLLLEEVWSGLGKLISFILFPGKFLKKTEQLALAQILGANVRHITIYKFLTPKSVSQVYMYFPEGRIGRSIIVFLSPIALNLMLAYLLLIIIVNLDDVFLLGLVSWLIISLVVTGFPDKADLAFVFHNFVTRDPSVLIYYTWGLVAGVIFYLVFGPQLTIFSLLTYYSIITISLIFVSPQVSSEFDVVFDEDELIE